MDNRFRRIIVLIAAMGGVLLGYLYVTESGAFDRSNQFFLFAKDIRDIQPETQVQFRGVTIGKVKALHVDSNQSNVIELAIDKGVAIDENAQFTRAVEGLLKRSYLKMEVKSTSGNTYFPGDTIRVPLVVQVPESN